MQPQGICKVVACDDLKGRPGPYIYGISHSRGKVGKRGLWLHLVRYYSVRWSSGNFQMDCKQKLRRVLKCDALKLEQHTALDATQYGRWIQKGFKCEGPVRPLSQKNDPGHRWNEKSSLLINVFTQPPGSHCQPKRDKQGSEKARDRAALRSIS